MELLYSNHAVKQMFNRSISTDEVEFTLKNGSTIIEYPEDKPYPSKLILAFCNKRPIHVVCSYVPAENKMIIITTYVPSVELWKDDFKTRKK